MPNVNKAPNYNLKVVIRETGIKPDTLRAWERRYGLPQPERSSGGHRLYSLFDIETIKWLMARQDEGLRINRAVKLWRDIEASGQDPLQSIPHSQAATRHMPLELLTGSELDELRENWIKACLVYDEATAENLLAQSFASYPLETVCLEILSRGLAEIGHQWYTGSSTVQQEHFASVLAIRRLNALLAVVPPPNRDARILIGCPPGEDHIVSGLIITLFLRRMGWNVVFLGANVPLDQLDATIRSTKTDLIIMSAQLLHSAASLYTLALYLRDRGVPLAFGGRIFSLLPELHNWYSAHYLGDSLDKVVPSVEQILTNPPEVPQTKRVTSNYTQALEEFRDKRSLIDAYIWEQIRINGMKEHHLEIANDFLGRDIEACLVLGDMNFLRPEIDWLQDLLIHRGIPSGIFPNYLAIYRQALVLNLNQQGCPIIEWFDQLIRDQE